MSWGVGGAGAVVHSAGDAQCGVGENVRDGAWAGLLGDRRRLGLVQFLLV